MPLRLRMLGPENIHELFTLINKNRDYLGHWFEWARHIKTESDCQKLLEKPVQTGLWLEDNLIGMVGFYEINWTDRHAELSYWISEEHQGKGYVRLAVQALMTYAFLEFKLNRIEILCVLKNTRSRVLAEKLGFTFEGIKREDYQLGGRFFDEACYSFLARDFHITGEEPYVQLARQIRSS